MTETRRLYYEDVYRKEFTATVLECRAVSYTHLDVYKRQVKIYGDGIMLESFPGQYPGVTKIQRTGRASLEETQEYEDKVNELMKPVAVQ